MAIGEDLENYTPEKIEEYTADELEQTFEEGTADTARRVHLFFFYNGQDRSEYVIRKNVGAITRTGDKITASDVSVALANTDNFWDMFFSDPTNLRKTAVLKVGNPAKATLFTGFANNVSYDGAKVILSLRDKFALLVQKEVGSDESPIDYYTSAYNPADLFWDIVTTYGELDSTASTDNVDINYSMWEDWKSDCDVLQFSLKARLTGQSIGEILRRIFELTQSFLYEDRDGRLCPYRFIPDPSETIPTIDKTIFGLDPKPGIEMDFSDLVNDVTCYYGYDPSADTWEGSVNASDATSKSNFYEVKDTMEDTCVWHATSASAQEYANRRLEVYKNPLKLITLGVHHIGATYNIAERKKVTMAMPGNLSETECEIWRIEDNILSSSRCTIVLRDASDDNLTPFRLDDTVYGLLDQTYNPLY